METYLKAQCETDDLLIDHVIGADEVERFSKSDLHWAKTKPTPLNRRNIRIGEVYQFEFGKNYKPEMSYEHRGLVLSVKNKLLYVLPIFSYDPRKHADVYHPVDYPQSKSDLLLLKSTEHAFIVHDSLLKLNDIRTVSVNRILYPHTGRILPTSDLFHKIEDLVIQKCFPNFCHRMQASTGK